MQPCVMPAPILSEWMSKAKHCAGRAGRPTAVVAPSESVRAVKAPGFGDRRQGHSVRTACDPDRWHLCDHAEVWPHAPEVPDLAQLRSRTQGPLVITEETTIAERALAMLSDHRGTRSAVEIETRIRLRTDH